MTVFGSLLNNLFTLYRRQRTDDGQGGWLISYTANGTAPGRMRPATSQEQDAAMQEERRISHVLYVAADADILRGDLVTGGGVAVDVEAVREPSLASKHLEIECLQRQKETATIVEGS